MAGADLHAGRRSHAVASHAGSGDFVAFDGGVDGAGFEVDARSVTMGDIQSGEAIAGNLIAHTTDGDRAEQGFGAGVAADFAGGDAFESDAGGARLDLLGREADLSDGVALYDDGLR